MIVLGALLIFLAVTYISRRCLIVAMGSSQSVIIALETVLKQRDIKIANRTLKNFIKEIDRVAPWYLGSGSLTLASWNKLGKDLDRKLVDGDLRQGTKAIWKLVKNCLEDEACRAVVAEGRNVLEEVQDSMSETERSERLGARKKRSVPNKENGPPGESNDKGVNPSDSKGPFPATKSKRGTSLYPMQELEALNLDRSDDSEGSENEELDSEEEAELDEEAARYERERYHPDDRVTANIENGSFIQLPHGWSLWRPLLTRRARSLFLSSHKR